MKFAGEGGGVVLTPVKMPNLDGEENDVDNDSVVKYQEAYKSVEYVQNNGQPGLTLHCGHCH